MISFYLFLFFIIYVNFNFKLGEYSGKLAFYNEIVVLPTIPLFGMLSDKIGRRAVYSFGIFMISISFLFASIINTWLQLVLTRLLFGIGASAAGAMITSLLADYPREESKGKSGGFVGIMAGLGAMFSVFLLLRIPRWTKIENVILSGQIMLWVAGGLGVIFSYILFFGLKSGTDYDHQIHPSWKRIIVEGFFAAKNPKVALSYLSALTSRGDAIIASMFLTLWVQHYYQALGKPEQEALARAGVVSGIAQTCALLFSPIVGFLSDKVPKPISVFIMGIIGFFGYMLMFILKSPIGAPVIIAAILVGCGEIGMTISSQVLLAHSAPKDVRGSTSGFFGIFSSIGIIIATRLGGYLFDKWTPGAPFFIFGILNIVTSLTGLIVFFVSRHMEKKAQQSIFD